ncbi:hypothetical protein ABFS83_12G045100 [Erythranthe nasuta]
MHHLGVKSNRNSESKNVGCNGHPIFRPKPRRLRSALPAHQFLCSMHHYQMNSEEWNGILKMIQRRNGGDELLGGCHRCSSKTCDWSVSPPGRTDNPLVHDIHFLQIHRYIAVFPPFTPL